MPPAQRASRTAAVAAPLPGHRGSAIRLPLPKRPVIAGLVALAGFALANKAIGDFAPSIDKLTVVHVPAVTFAGLVGDVSAKQGWSAVDRVEMVLPGGEIAVLHAPAGTAIESLAGVAPGDRLTLLADLKRRRYYEIRRGSEVLLPMAETAARANRIAALLIVGAGLLMTVAGWMAFALRRN